MYKPKRHHSIAICMHVSTLQFILLFILILGYSGCTSNMEEDPEMMEEVADEAVLVADVVSVSVSTSRVFSVGIKSPDTGCDQYANWWEVITPQGVLLYRRILAHSHITEQPFVRSGGPVAIDETTEVYVRAHMHPTGYGGVAYKGSVGTGFTAFELDAEFASALATTEPLPVSCTN